MPFHFIVRQQQGEEVLILFQSLNQRIINVIKIGELKIFLSIILCAGFQLVRLHQNISNLKHCLYNNIIIVRFARATVDFVDDFGQSLLFVFSQAEMLRRWQLHNLTFSVDNICDFIVYRSPLMHLMELKTIDTPSIPLQKIFGKYDPEKKQYHKIKHITDMVTAAQTEGITAHVIINYRGKVNRTFAVQASDVLQHSVTESRKSIPWQWAAEHGTEITQRQLKVHWRYDVDGFLRGVETLHG